MKKFSLSLIIIAILAMLNASALFAQQELKISYTLSMLPSKAGKFHVELFCEGIKGELQDFKMPAISPGYYRVLDFARNVENFNADDGKGNLLTWEKTTANTWRVVTHSTPLVRIRYDVKSELDSVATAFIDEKRAYVSSPAVFMYPDGQINHSLTLTLIVPPQFQKISTGLEPVENKPNTYYASCFDIFYDCPLYLGNQEVISFEVKGIPHFVAMESPGTWDRQQLQINLKKAIEAATELMGDIPYKHYTFIFMGDGKGGLEHGNSTAEFLDVSGKENPGTDKRTLKFLIHEYFHLYNVKSIRPIALGPFDYDGENNTRMLWFSEGGTVYYEYLILNRAGFFTREECLEDFASIIADNENNPAHRTQSVAEASMKAWTQSFFGNKKEVSYYDKGLTLSILLDLRIRHESKNKKSLDDAMRIFYTRFYKEQSRGFTDKEFQQVCEELAGVSLSDFFSYIGSTEELDYGRYLGYAGLSLTSGSTRDKKGKKHFRITPLPNPDSLQQEILSSWLKE